MKKKVFSFIVIEIINIASLFMLVLGCDTKYIGIDFSFDLNGIIFSYLSFVSLFLFLNNFEANFFNENMIEISIRINKRFNLAIYEVLKQLIIIIIYEITEITSIILFSLLLNRKFELSGLLMFFVLNLGVKLFYSMIMTILQIIFSKSYGFIIICVIHLLLILTGSGIYTVLQDGTYPSVDKLLTIANVLNISNYISLERLNVLTKTPGIAVLIIFSVIIVLTAAFVLYGKKIDILRKE